VIIKIERSGGITGILRSNVLNSKDLPITLRSNLKKIIENPKPGSGPLRSPPRGAADYYTYKISIKEGTKEDIMEFNQYNMIDELKALIKYVEKNLE